MGLWEQNRRFQEYWGKISNKTERIKEATVALFSYDYLLYAWFQKQRLPVPDHLLFKTNNAK